MRLPALALLAAAPQAAQAAPPAVEAPAVSSAEDYLGVFDQVCFATDGALESRNLQGATWDDLPKSLHFLRNLPGTHTVQRFGGDKPYLVVLSVGDPAGNGQRDRACAIVFPATGHNELVAATADRFKAQPSPQPIPLGEAAISSVSRDGLLINVASSPEGYLVLRRLQLAQSMSPPAVPVAR